MYASYFYYRNFARDRCFAGNVHCYAAQPTANNHDIAYGMRYNLLY